MPAPERLLLVRLDGMGDTVLTTPLLRALKEAWPSLAITCVASPAGAAALQSHPAVTTTHVIDPRRSSLLDKLRLGQQLRAQRFDVALAVTEKAWGYLWAWMSGAALRAGFWAGSTQPLKALLFWPTLTHRIANPNDPSRPSDTHEADRILRLLGPLGVAAQQPRAWLAGPGWTAPASPRIALHLSLKWLADGYTEAWLAELLASLRERAGGRLAVSAGPAEQPWADAFLARQEGLERLDTSTFATWCAGLASSSLLVPPDTGAVHVGAALGIPVVDVFAERGNEHCVPRWKPYGVPHRVVLRGRGDDHAEAARAMKRIVDETISLLEASRHDP